MAVTSVVNRNAQAATTPPPGAQKAADQFSKVAQQATRSGEAANTKGADGQNTAVKTDQSKVQGRGERDQDQGDQNHSGKQIRLVNGVRVTTTDGHVTGRVNIRSNNETNVTAGPQNTAMNTPEMKQATGPELRNPSQALPAAGPTAGSVVLTMPRPLEARSTRPGETSGKVSNDFASSGTTSSLIAEAAIRDQPDNGGSSDGGSGDQGGDTSGGNNSGEDLGSGDLGAGGIGGGGGNINRPTATGASPEPDDVGVSRIQLIANWLARHPDLSEEQSAAITLRFVDLELSQPDYNFDMPELNLRDRLKTLARFLVTEKQEERPGWSAYSGQLSIDEAMQLIESLVESKRNKPEREAIIGFSAEFVRSCRYGGGFEEVNADYREAFALASRHDIRRAMYLMLLQLSQNADYNTLDLNLLRSPERDNVMAYFLSSADDPRRKASVSVIMMTEGMDAEEAGRQLDLGGRAERIGRWAQVMPGNIGLSAFNQMLELEDALGGLVRNDDALLDVMSAPLEVFTRQGFAADESFSCLENVLRSWHSDPLGPFLEPTRPSWEDTRASLSARNTLAQFPTAIISRMASNSIDPATVASLLVGPSFEGSPVPAPPKYAISILQAASGNLTLPKLQELVPYLNESRLAPTLLIAITQRFLNGEAQLPDPEQQPSMEIASIIGTMSANERRAMAIETALNDLYGGNVALRDNRRVFLDLETAETTVSETSSNRALDDDTLRNRTSFQFGTVELHPVDGTNSEFGFMSYFSFKTQLPGQANLIDVGLDPRTNLAMMRLPSGTEINMDFRNSSGEPRNVAFRLPPIRRAAEG
jgi:hypothetical protein